MASLQKCPENSIKAGLSSPTLSEKEEREASAAACAYLTFRHLSELSASHCLSQGRQWEEAGEAWARMGR